MTKVHMSELELKDFIFDRFIPAIHCTLNTANREEFKKWQGNCCMQTAILVSNFLLEKMPDYKWFVYEGIFTTSDRRVQSPFNHAWVYGQNEKKDGIFIDGAHLRSKRLWFHSDVNEYPDSVKQGKFLEFVDFRRCFKPRPMLDVTEYFTSDSASRLYVQVLEYAYSDCLLSEALLESLAKEWW